MNAKWQKGGGEGFQSLTQSASVANALPHLRQLKKDAPKTAKSLAWDFEAQRESCHERG